jgi:uncharacterized membrane protein
MIAAVFGALSIAAFGWLCLEIFSSQFIAFVGSFILALAPFHILYSQQNREYSLWFLIICLSTAVLLAANRSQKKSIGSPMDYQYQQGFIVFYFFFPFSSRTSFAKYLHGEEVKTSRLNSLWSLRR